MDREYNEEERKFLVKEMCRVALRTNEPELRDLKQKLENDYIRKNQSCQIKENEYRALQKQVEKRRQDQYLLEKEMKYLEIQEQENKKKYIQKNLYGKDLLSQVNVHEKTLTLEKELDAQKRREELNKLANELKEDIEKKLGDKIFAVEATQHEMMLFQRAKEIDDIKQHLISVEESQMIEKTNRELDERLKMTAEEKKRKFELREALKGQIAANLFAQQVAIEERAQLFRELEEHAYLENSKHSDDNQSHYSYNQKKKVHNMLKAQIQANIDRAYMLKKQEAEFTQQLNREIQRQNELKENDQKVATLRKQEYATDIKKQIADNLEKQRLQNETIMMTNEYIKTYNDEKRRQIEEEKELMIKEHNLKVAKSLHYT